MILTRLTCGNFITFKLSAKRLLAQHIPLHIWVLPYRFTEAFCTGGMIPFMDSHLCGFLATAEAPNPVLHAGAVCPQTAGIVLW